MKNCKFCTIILLGFLLIFSTKNVKGDVNFTTDSNVEYKVQTTGETVVTNTITIRNRSSQLYAKSYILNLNNVNAKNIKAYEASDQLNVFQEKFEDLTKVRVELGDPITGEGKSRTFVVTYTDDTLATKTGEVWEITIPKLAQGNSFREYDLILSVPEELGQEAYITPEPRSVSDNEGRKLYKFQKEDIEKSGVNGGFGLFQSFSFILNYHLENATSQKVDREIAIPPDTSLQRVFYSKIQPKPTNINVDDDGNWLANFTLSPREKLDVKVEGSVQIFAKPRKLITTSPTTLLENLKPSEFWQTQDEQIHNLALELKTPEAIYSYVTKNLNYNYDRVNPDVSRLGAKLALANPDDAMCMEFTDLFIALARSAGIPAREVNGYAYSENAKIQPLSLVADVLHAWPEYWSDEADMWIAVDPTWESTSGIDYFSKLDLRHFTFVIHGKDPTTPLSPGSYKLGKTSEKDVFVSFGTIPEERVSNVQIEVSYPYFYQLFNKTVNVSIINKGSTAVYNIEPKVLYGENVANTTYISVLPPNASAVLTFQVPYGFLGRKVPNNVTVLAYRSKVELPINKNNIIITQLLIFTIISKLAIMHPSS